MKYENLSVQALKCMYVSTALSSLLALAVLGAVNYFYLIPEDIVPGKLASLILAVLICLNPSFQSLVPLSPLPVQHQPGVHRHPGRLSVYQTGHCPHRTAPQAADRQRPSGPDLWRCQSDRNYRRRRCHHPLSGRKTGRGDRRQPAPPDQPDCNRTEERLWKHQLDFAIISRSLPNGWSGDWYF